MIDRLKRPQYPKAWPKAFKLKRRIWFNHLKGPLSVEISGILGAFNDGSITFDVSQPSAIPLFAMTLRSTINFLTNGREAWRWAYKGSSTNYVLAEGSGPTLKYITRKTVQDAIERWADGGMAQTANMVDWQGWLVVSKTLVTILNRAN
jgi:hypothetical protein